MLAASVGFLSLSLSSFFTNSHALKFPIQRRAVPRNTVVVTNPSNVNNVGFSDAWQSYGLYTVTVYVQGQPFQVQLDTGSSDLWIDTTMSNVTLEGLIDTGYNVTDQYVDTTESSGPVVLANVTLGEFTVEGQAMVNAMGSNATTVGGDVGLLGIGPPLTSQIYQETMNSSVNGLPFLNNVFDYYPEGQAFITLLLTRSNIGITEGGVFSISELVADYASITDTPKLEVYSDHDFLTWLDGIYVNGEFISGHSKGVDGLNANAEPGTNQTTVVLDSGTTLIAAPPYYVDAIYKNIPGANFSDQWNGYQIPCSTKLNISMKFGDNVYPIDPIDATYMSVNVDGSVQCYSTFVYMSEGQPLDWLLGDAFLRNVYSLFYYGHWTVSSADTPPYMQILSVTDADAAWEHFDALNLQRIAELEWQQIQANVNITSSYAEAASMSKTYSLVTPTAVLASTSAVPSSSWASASDSASWPSASASDSASLSSADPSLSSASDASSTPSQKAASTPPSASASDASHSTNPSSYPSSAAATPSTSAGAAAAVRPNADLASSDSSSSSTPNLSGLLRNSYIIMGLIGGVLALLLGVLIKLIKDSRNTQYRAVPNIIRPPMHFTDKPYEPDEEFTTPYDDPARRT